MPIVPIWEGSSFNIYAWGDDQCCDLLDFLEQLKQTGSAEHDKIYALIKYSAEHRPPRNPEKCRPLGGDDASGLFEFKTPGGVRVAWFYDKGGRIICTHGFNKPSKKSLKKEIQKALAIRDRYFEEREDD
jgi:hypothetical protein